MKIIKTRSSILSATMMLALLLASGCSSGTPSTPETVVAPPPLATETTAPEIVIEPTADSNSGWKLYQHPTAKFSFQYPESWFGPEVYEADQDLRIEIGSDMVYPYGTGSEDRNLTQKDSYYILIEYRPNTTQMTMEDYKTSSWISPIMDIFELADGETISTARSLVIRVREFELGQFKGVEYISTLSETAQTEHVYSRQIFLIDEELNILMISGSANNVEILDGANWKADYQRVDQANLDIFYQVIESIAVE